MPYKSEKQRRLMQAVAHNPQFAKKVGIPQSVGRKFEEHKAKGGKVGTILDILKRIKDEGSMKPMEDEFKKVEALHKSYPTVDELLPEHSELARYYMGDTSYDINARLRGYPTEPSDLDDPETYQSVLQALDEMLQHYPLKHNMPLLRGVGDVPVRDLLGRDPAYGSFTVKPDVAEKFTESPGEMHKTIMMLDAPEGSHSLPLRRKKDRYHEGEVLLPRNMEYEQLDDPFSLGEITLLPVRNKTRWADGGKVEEDLDDYLKRTYPKKPAPPKPKSDHPFADWLWHTFVETDPTVVAKDREAARKRVNKAEGGPVAEPKNALGTISKIARSLSLSEGNKSSNQRVTAGLMKQLYGLDKNREPAFLGGFDSDPNPGIVDEILSLPMLLELIGVDPPEVSKQAQRDLDELSMKVNRDMGLQEAHGFRERGQEALGTMLGQIPVAATKAPKAVATGGKKLADNFLKAMEWFTPTVERNPLNYAIGTATGGGLGGTADMLGDMSEEIPAKVPVKKADGGLVQWFGKGGKVEALVDAVRMLKRKLTLENMTPDQVETNLHELSATHGVRPEKVMEILESTPFPSAQIDTVVKGEAPMPSDDELGFIAKALQLRSRLDEPQEWLRGEIPTLTDEGREDLATSYAKALGSYYDMMEKPSSEILGVYENLTNDFVNRATPFKPKMAMGGPAHKCSCQE